MKKFLFSLTNGRKFIFFRFCTVSRALIKMGKYLHRVNRYYVLFLIVYSINIASIYQHNGVEEQQYSPTGACYEE